MQITKDKQMKSTHEPQKISADIFKLKKDLRKPATQEEKQNVADQISHLQYEWLTLKPNTLLLSWGPLFQLDQKISQSNKQK